MFYATRSTTVVYGACTRHGVRVFACVKNLGYHGPAFDDFAYNANGLGMKAVTLMEETTATERQTVLTHENGVVVRGPARGIVVDDKTGNVKNQTKSVIHNTYQKYETIHNKY